MDPGLTPTSFANCSRVMRMRSRTARMACGLICGPPRRATAAPAWRMPLRSPEIRRRMPASTRLCALACRRSSVTCFCSLRSRFCAFFSSTVEWR
jgi:hypothetical protein